MASNIQSTAKPMVRTRRAAKEAEAKKSAAASKKPMLNPKTPKPIARGSVIETNASKHPLAAHLMSVHQSAKKSLALARKSIMTAKKSLLNAKTPLTVRKQSIGLLKSAIKNVNKK